MTRALIGLLAAFLIVIAAARFAYSVTAGTGEQPAKAPWSQDTMRLVAWNDERWTAWIRDGVFELVPQNTDDWSRHSNGSLAFIDWDGEPWQAKIDGDEFLLAQRGDWSGSVERADAIRYRDWSGMRQLRTVADLRR